MRKIRSSTNNQHNNQLSRGQADVCSRNRNLLYHKNSTRWSPTKLNPTLCSIFTNNITTTSNTQLAVYADETAIYASSWNPQQATKYIQHHLNQIIEYMNNCKLRVNPHITQAITFTRKRISLIDQVEVLGQKIYWTAKVKHLGPTLEYKLIWAPAIAERARLVHPALRKIYPLISKSSKLKKEIKLILYKVCVRTIITYGHPVWAAASGTHINIIQRTQNKFLRIILDINMTLPYQHCINMANIQTIQEFITDPVNRAYNDSHLNPLIRGTGNCNIQDLRLKIRVRLPKHIAKHN